MGRSALAAALALVLFLIGAFGLLRHTGQSSRPSERGGAVPGKPAALQADPVVLGGSLQQVIAQLQARLRALPRDWESWAQLGLGYVQEARITADPSYYPRAEGALRRSLRMNGNDNFDAMTGMAALAAARHDFAGALSWGQRAAGVNPDNANIHNVIGDALIELGRYDQAFAEIQKAVDLRPSLSSYARVSYARELQGDVKGALGVMAMAERSSATPSDMAWTLNQIGDLRLGSGAVGAAAKSYRRALEADPSFVPPRAGLARVAFARGDMDRAIAGFGDVVARYPLPEYLIALGDLYTVAGKADLAAQQYSVLHAEERLFRANGVNLDLEMALFDADHGVNLTEGLAAAQGEWARRRSIHVADALAWELYAAGRYDEALTYANRALSLGTRNALFLFHRAMIERALGRRDAARRDMDTAGGINPHFSILWAEKAERILHGLGGGA